ncbi:MAG: sensor histidine kinase [Myxococcota bacterium]
MRLEFKLALLVLALTTLLLGALGVTLGLSLGRWSEQVVDDELARRAAVLEHEVHFDDGALELDDDDDLSTRGLPFRLETPDGRLLFGAREWPTGSTAQLGFVTVHGEDERHVRVLSQEFTPKHGGGQRLVLRVAAPLRAVAGVTHRFRQGLIVALALAAVLSGLGGLLLARWFLRPLRRLTADVDALEARSVAGRLDTRGLDPSLARLASAFNALLERVSAVMMGQRDFVARASHALRTPLAGMLTEAEVALRRERSAAEYRATLSAIVETTREAAQLTEGLLALTRADAATGAQREAVELSALFDELARVFHARVEAAGLTLERKVAAGLTVRATRSRLREMLDALLDNAVRYTPRGGTIFLEASADGERVLVAVSDTGQGVAEAERARIFERFSRGSAAERSGQPGSGLGLAVVKALVEAEGGAVTVAAREGGGAVFTLAFPR